MKQGLLIAIGFLTLVTRSHLALALNKGPNIDGEFYAFRFAQLMNRPNTSDELAQRLPLAKQDLDLLKNQLKKEGPSTSPVAKQLEPTVVTVAASGHSAVVNFSEILQQRIFIDGHVVAITPAKNFLNYRSEIVQILKNEAMGSWIAAATIGTIDAVVHRPERMSLEKMNRPFVQRRLAMDIIQAYDADEHLYTSGVYGSSVAQYAPLVFSCENGNLQRLGRLAGTDAQSKPIIKDGLKRTGPVTFSFTTFQRSPDAQLDQNFNVVRPGGRLVRGQNLLTADEDYGHFPEIAQECCSMKGCYEQVSAGIQSNANPAAVQ